MCRALVITQKSKQVLQSLKSCYIGSFLVLILNLDINFFSVDRDLLGRGNAELDLVSPDVQNSDLDIVIYDDKEFTDEPPIDSLNPGDSLEENQNPYVGFSYDPSKDIVKGDNE